VALLEIGGLDFSGDEVGSQDVQAEAFDAGSQQIPAQQVDQDIGILDDDHG
jgi:hypothetical protein